MDTTTKDVYGTRTYLAVNGHTMIGETLNGKGINSWRAQHADECPCWDSEEGFTGFDNE